MDLMSRSEWLAVRDAMLAAEVRPSTINKLLTKAKMCVTNGAIVIHTQRLKSDPGGNLLS